MRPKIYVAATCLKLSRCRQGTVSLSDGYGDLKYSVSIILHGGNSKSVLEGKKLQKTESNSTSNHSLRYGWDYRI